MLSVLRYIDYECVIWALFPDLTRGPPVNMHICTSRNTTDMNVNTNLEPSTPSHDIQLHKTKGYIPPLLSLVVI